MPPEVITNKLIIITMNLNSNSCWNILTEFEESNSIEISIQSSIHFIKILMLALGKYLTDIIHNI